MKLITSFQEVSMTSSLVNKQIQTDSGGSKLSQVHFFCLKKQMQVSTPSMITGLNSNGMQQYPLFA